MQAANSFFLSFFSFASTSLKKIIQLSDISGNLGRSGHVKLKFLFGINCGSSPADLSSIHLSQSSYSSAYSSPYHSL